MISVELLSIFTKIKEGKEISREEAQEVGQFINGTNDYVSAIVLYSGLQKHQRNLVRVHPLVYKKIVQIVTMSDELQMDELFFEQWYSHSIKMLSSLEFPLQNHLQDLEAKDEKVRSNNWKNYWEWVKKKPNPYIDSEAYKTREAYKKWAKE